VDCPDDKKFQVVEKVAVAVRQRYKVVDVDGVRAIFDHGWGLVRASNTQPVLVMRFEATSDKLLADYRAELESVVEEAKRASGVQ
jgi:phosphomannomutase/phosphoglucomutase